MNLYFFDKISITIFVVALVAQIIFILLSKTYNNYKRPLIMICLLLLIGQVFLIWGNLIEPQIITVTKKDIKISDNPQTEIKIALIGDYHIGPYKNEKFVRRTIDKINKENPDIVFLVGDFIYSYQEQADELAPLQNLSTKYGVYAVLGNHDYGLTESNGDDYSEAGAQRKSQYVKEKLKEFGVNVLENEKIQININGNDISLIGLTDLWGSNYDVKQGLELIDEEETTLLLEHNPDIILFEKALNADLILSGHTHGGQIRLPIIGGLAGVPTQIGEKYDYGLFEVGDNSKLFITKGIGEMGPRARLFCPPEIVILNVRF